MLGVSVTLHEVGVLAAFLAAVAIALVGLAVLGRCCSRAWFLTAIAAEATGVVITVVLASSAWFVALGLLTTALLIGAIGGVAAARAELRLGLVLSWSFLSAAAASFALFVASPFGADLRTLYPSEARCLAALAASADSSDSTSSLAGDAWLVTTTDGRRYLLTEISASREASDQILCGPEPLLPAELADGAVTLSLARPPEARRSQAEIREGARYRETKEGYRFGETVRQRGRGYYQLALVDGKI